MNLPEMHRSAVNNAHWCDAVCRAHAIDSTFDEDAWTSRTRTPPFYPDAVTLIANPSIPELLARIDVSAGCSIKDSFASLDLSAFGFRVLFDAQWITRPATTAAPNAADPSWEVVRDPEAFATWERAWRGEDGPPGVLRAELLDNDSVAVLAARVGERVVAGAVLNRTGEEVGISNLFAGNGDAAACWAGCIATAGTLFPGSVLVGYESGNALEMARSHGFEATGPLRVWIRDR